MNENSFIIHRVKNKEVNIIIMLKLNMVCIGIILKI